jgi:disulfide bond formation protein DsbB
MNTAKLNTITRSIRPAMLLGLLLTITMIAIALLFQYIMELEPCPLCSVERAVVITMALIFLIAFLHGPASWGRRIYAFILVLSSSAGIAVSGRHTWLQHLPKEKIPECGPGLNFWIENLPPNEVIQKLFKGSGECAEVSWTLIGLSIPEWSLIIFILFLAYSLKLLFLGR